MNGKRVKQINNLIIRYTDEFQYAVWTPDGRCWEDRLTLEQAEDFCRNTKDFVQKSVDKRLADAQERIKNTVFGNEKDTDYIKE